MTNFLSLSGISISDVDMRIDEWWDLYFGNANPAYKLMHHANENEAYILCTDAQDIRSEGMSYGMMICVQLDKKEEFDRLWTFAKTRLQHQDGARQGYFAWHCEAKAPYKILDPNPAPDGEEYFAMSLFFAARRWGNGEGIYNYRNEAQAILNDMTHKSISPEQMPMWNSSHHQIVFTTDPFTDQITDPSYHLPAFYELWAREQDKNSEEEAFWNEAARISRVFLRRALHPKTGLSPNYANFDGSPYAATWVDDHDHFGFDAFRTIMNIAMDWNWFKRDPWQAEIASKLLSFFQNQEELYSQYTLTGSPLNDSAPAPLALIAMNASAAMCTPESEEAKWALQKFWQQEAPQGEYRYYDAMLSFLSLLHLSGRFTIFADNE
jgi:oligosaccharide reducing-end xylanase